MTETTVTAVAYDWVDLGVGPLLLSAAANGVVFALSTAKPEHKQGFPISIVAPTPVSTSDHIWVMTIGPNLKTHVVWAPMTPTEGGGSLEVKFPTYISTPQEK